MQPKDKLVDPNPLRIVRGPVAREVALEMVHGLSPVRLYWQMTPRARGRPGEVTGEAFHTLLGMRQGTGLGWRTAPGFAVLLYGLGETGFLVVVSGLWIDAIHHLHDFPFQIFGDIGALKEHRAPVPLAPYKASLTPGGIQLHEIVATLWRSKPRST